MTLERVALAEVAGLLAEALLRLNPARRLLTSTSVPMTCVNFALKRTVEVLDMGSLLSSWRSTQWDIWPKPSYTSHV